MHKSFLALAVSAAALLVTPAVATAAPDGTISLEPGKAKFAWTGGPGTGVAPWALDQVGIGPVSQDSVECGQPTVDCVDKLVKVDSAGDLTFEMHGEAGDTPAEIGLDIDVFLYTSDAAGTIGEEIASGITSTGDELAIAYEAPAGYYFARVLFYAAVNATFDASLTVSEPVPAEEGEGDLE